MKTLPTPSRRAKQHFENLFNEDTSFLRPKTVSLKEIISCILKSPEKKQAILKCFKRGTLLFQFIHGENDRTKFKLNQGDVSILFEELKKLKFTIKEVDALYSTDKDSIEALKKALRIEYCKKLDIEVFEKYLNKNVSEETISNDQVLVFAIHYWYANQEQVKENLQKLSKKSELPEFLKMYLSEDLKEKAHQELGLRDISLYEDNIINFFFSFTSVYDYYRDKAYYPSECDLFQRSPSLLLERLKSDFPLSNYFLDQTVSKKPDIVKLILSKNEDEKEKLLFDCFNSIKNLYRYIHKNRSGDDVNFERRFTCANTLFNEYRKIIVRKINSTVLEKGQGFSLERINHNLKVLEDIKNKVNNFISKGEYYYSDEQFRKQQQKIIDQYLALNHAHRFLLTPKEESQQPLTLTEIDNLFNFLADKRNQKALDIYALKTLLDQHLNNFREKMKNNEVFGAEIVAITFRAFHSNTYQSQHKENIKQFFVKCFSFALANGILEGYTNYEDLFTLIPLLRNEWLDGIIDKLNTLKNSEKSKFVISCFEPSKKDGMRLTDFIWRLKKTNWMFQRSIFSENKMHEFVNTLLNSFFTSSDTEDTNQLFHAIAKMINEANLSASNDHVILIGYVWEKLSTADIIVDVNDVNKKFIDVLKNENIKISHDQFNNIKKLVKLDDLENLKNLLIQSNVMEENKKEIKSSVKTFKPRDRSNIELESFGKKTSMMPNS